MLRLPSPRCSGIRATISERMISAATQLSTVAWANTYCSQNRNYPPRDPRYASHSAPAFNPCKLVATLDDLLGGRAILGVGAGSSKPEFDGYGKWSSSNLRVTKADEAVRLILRLWTETKSTFMEPTTNQKMRSSSPSRHRNLTLPSSL